MTAKKKRNKNISPPTTEQVENIYIIETNVLLAANGDATQVSDKCVENCIHLLREIWKKAENGLNNNIVVLDNAGIILKEYGKKVNKKRSDLEGSQFLIWLYLHQWKERCHLVEITELGENKYKEFPNDDLALVKFDPSDRKFVALALAYAKHYNGVVPIILNATDSDWVEYETALASHGITIEFLCGKNLKSEQSD